MFSQKSKLSDNRLLVNILVEIQWSSEYGKNRCLFGVFGSCQNSEEL